MPANEIGARLGHEALHNGADSGMDGYDPALAGFGFCAPRHCACLKVYGGFAQIQKLADAPAAINQDQGAVGPRFALAGPKGLNFIVGEPASCGWRHRVGSEQIGIAAVDDIQLQGEAIQVAPKVFDRALGAVASAAAVDAILHLICLDLLIGQVLQGGAMPEGAAKAFLIGNAQFGHFLFLPQLKQLPEGDFGPVHVPGVAVVFGQQQVALFPGGRVADDAVLRLAVFFPAGHFFDDIRPPAGAGQLGHRAISIGVSQKNHLSFLQKWLQKIRAGDRIAFVNRLLLGSARYGPRPPSDAPTPGAVFLRLFCSF